MFRHIMELEFLVGMDVEMAVVLKETLTLVELQVVGEQGQEQMLAIMVQDTMGQMEAQEQLEYFHGRR